MELTFISGTNNTSLSRILLDKCISPICITFKVFPSSMTTLWFRPAMSLTLVCKMIVLHMWSVAPLSIIQWGLRKLDAWNEVPARYDSSKGRESLLFVVSFLPRSMSKILYYAVGIPELSTSTFCSDSSLCLTVTFAAGRLYCEDLLDDGYPWILKHLSREWPEIL